MIEGIEQDTLEDPPLLFREYVGAPVEIKRIMDSQFKLVKTWARLKAKGGWYSWRDQLLGGVMPTLHKNADGLRKVPPHHPDPRSTGGFLFDGWLICRISASWDS